MRNKNLLKIITITIFFLIPFCILHFSCKNDKNNVENLPDTNSFDYNSPQIVKIENKVFSVPSPMQASALVKDKNIPFDPDLLNKASNHVKYLTSFKQALNIGVYGADMGNLFLYDQLSQSAEYFSVIKNLSEDVGIMNSINESVLNRIENNNTNRDSLMYIISEVYREIDSYLLENEQGELGILIITGGWVESIFMLTKIAETTKDPEIISRIGEQQNPLNNLIELLQPYYGQKSDDFDYLLEALVELSITFDAIEATYVYEEPVVDEINKTSIINSTTTYNITQEQLTDITDKISKLREWIISE